MKEVLLAMLAGSLETIGESKFIAFLNKKYADNPRRCTLIVQGAYPLAVMWVEEAEETKTPIDDAFAAALKDGIEKFAADKNIELPAVPE